MNKTNIREAIEKALPEGHALTKNDIAAVYGAVKEIVGAEYVPTTDYRKKIDRINELETEMSDISGQVADGKTYKDLYEAEKTAKGTLQEQFDQYKTEQEKTFNEFKQGVESEKQTAQIQSALSDRLIRDGANPKLVKLLLKEIDTTKAELKDGDIANYDDLTKTVKEGYSEVFGTVQTKGAEVADPPAGGGNKNYTIEQIKAMSPKEINANWADVQKALKNNT